MVTAQPNLSRIAALANPANKSYPPMLSRLRAVAQQSGRRVLPIEVRTVGDIERGFATMAREKADAMIIFIDGFLFQQRKQIADLSLKHRVPSIYPTPGYAEVGGLMSCGADITDNYRRAAVFVDKILKGANPGELPFEQPARYYLEINRKTANAPGIKVPQELLMRTDKAIE